MSAPARRDANALARATGFGGLHVLADDDPRHRWDPVDQARAACAGGAAVVQLRAKHAPDREALAWAVAIRALTRAVRARFVMNDRFDLALLAGADAVHLGQDDLAPAAIPVALRARLAVGRSTHTLEQAHAAVREGVDYVAFGPIFGTASKRSPWPARGLDALRAVVMAVHPLPVIAIGGIDAARAPAVAATGARGIAVIGAVVDAPDVSAATRTLLRAFAGPGAAATARRDAPRAGA